LARSVSLAESNQARLRVVMVAEKISLGMGMPEGGPISKQLQNALLRDSEEFLKRAISPYRDRVDIDTAVLLGTPFLEVIREVLKSRHDLIVKTAENPEWLDRLFGSDDMHLLRKCPCPVWLLNPGVPERFRNILAAVDVDDAYGPEELGLRLTLNDQVLQLAASLAVTEFARLHIGHAWDEMGVDGFRGGFLRKLKGQLDPCIEQLRLHRKDKLDRLAQRLASEVGPEVLEIQSHLVKGRPREAIPALVSTVDADLVIMGTVARTGIPGYIVGNTAEMILSQITCSVLAVKPPGFTSPIEFPNPPD
jgi:nucleotide-binding universal stress UspA family protein